jgi:hypothetical protein
MKDITFDWCAARAAAQLTRWVADARKSKSGQAGPVGSRSGPTAGHQPHSSAKAGPNDVGFRHTIAPLLAAKGGPQTRAQSCAGLGPGKKATNRRSAVQLEVSLPLKSSEIEPSLPATAGTAPRWAKVAAVGEVSVSVRGK